MKHASEVIRESFEVEPKRFVEANAEDERTEAFSQYFQMMLDEGSPNAVDDCSLIIQYNLSWFDRIKALLSGKYRGEVGVFVAQGVGFGISWQHHDILDALKLEDKDNKTTDENTTR